MRRELLVEVRGVPIPQGSLRALKSKDGSPYVTHANSDLKAWRELVRQAVADKLRNPEDTPLEGPVYAYLVFTLPRPKSAKRRLPHVRPDVDKLTRAAFDAVTDAGAWSDDGQVTEVHAFKKYVTYGKAPSMLLFLKELD